MGAVYEGKVTGITAFGAFVLLPVGKSGMVHISEVANTYVDDIHKHLTEGQSVTVKVINIDPAGRINLSIKKAMPSQPLRPQSTQTTLPKTQDELFEDRLKQFMQASESKISDSKLYNLKKNTRRRGK